jgi:hypothetical protein
MKKRFFKETSNSNEDQRLPGNNVVQSLFTKCWENALSIVNTKDILIPATEDILALLHSIVSFKFESLARRAKDINLSTVIQHIGGGAKTSHTAFKQKMIPIYKLEMQSETTLMGAAKLAIETLELEGV